MADINHKSEFYYTVLKYFARITQFLSWPFLFILFNLFFRLEFHGLNNIRKMKSPFIIISNHISTLDSFIFRLLMGPFNFNLPLRFMAVNQFRSKYLNFLSKIFIIDIIYGLFGVFTVIKGRGIERNLIDAIRIIENKGNVVIYPEGSIENDGKVHEFKIGSSVLAQRTNVPVLPVSMKFGKGIFRKKFIVNIGEIIEYSALDNTKNITDLFKRKVEDLFNGI